MKITVQRIVDLYPCKDRLDNFLKHYPNFSGTMHRFLNLEHITHEDKCWVYFRLMPTELINKVTADMAHSVLYSYEAAYPGDDRPLKAIEAARAGDKNAAYDAYFPAIAAAANANGYAAAARAAAIAAAASTIDHVHAAKAAAYAAYAAAYAAYAAYDSYSAHATYAAAYAIRAAPDQERVQIQIMKKYVKGIK